MERAIVDANAVVSHLLGRDSVLAEAIKAYDILEVSLVVIFEVVYVLESNDLARGEVFEKLANLFFDRRIEVEGGRRVVLNTLLYYKNMPKFDLADCYLLALSQERKIDVVTIDEDLKKAVEKNTP